MKKIMSFVLISALAFSMLVGCGAKEDAGKTNTGTENTESLQASEEEKELEKITFVLDWTPNTNHTGLYVAQKLGYFEEAGLEVEIVQPPEDGAVVLVASGKAQFGVSFQDSLAPALIEGDAIPVTAVASVIQHNTSGIISRAGEGMDRPKGMAGHSYATWNGAIELATIEKVVEADGGDYSKVELIPSTVTDEVSALKTNSVDSIWIFYAWAGVKTELEGLETDYFAFADIDPVFDYYTPVIISGNKFLEENPETAKAFLSALSKGYEFAIENPEEAAEILCDAAPELDKELVVASQKYLADQYRADAPYWGFIDADRWNNFYKWVNDNKLVEGNVMLNSGFTNEYLPQYEEPMPVLEVKGVSKSFDGEEIIRDITMELKEGELVSLLGVSGGGKTTLFNLIAGLSMPDQGTIFLEGENITGKPGNVSYMLQKDLLLPYRTIVDNVALPLTIRGMKKSEAREKAAGYFEEFGLKGAEKKYPTEVSGGMKQRAALLRTYLFSEKVALLDEPFSALDMLTKASVHEWYLDVMEKIKLSTLFITHDIDEAILLSDRIYLLTGKPGTLTKEIVIKEPKPRKKGFNLSENFLQYKREIISHLEG